MFEVEPKDWTCGKCGSNVAASIGYSTHTAPTMSVLPCPQCGTPSWFIGDEHISPRPMPGAPIADLPDDIAAIYEEARTAIGGRAFTAAVLLFRKMLVHLSHAQTGLEKGTFKQHVDALCAKAILPPNASEWLHFVRDEGNEVTHELVTATEGQAMTLLKVAIHVLRTIYEVPAEVARAKGT